MIDINTHIIVFSNIMEIKYELNLKSNESGEQFNSLMQIIIYFDIYPIENYYAIGGYGYYKLMYEQLCKEKDNYNKNDLYELAKIAEIDINNILPSEICNKLDIGIKKLNR